MALTSPALTVAVPALFGAVRPTLDTLRRIGATDFSADAPDYDIKPGATIKIPISSVSAASAYDESTNNYLTGGTTDWASLTCTHYLKGFDISGVNVDQGVDAAKMKQLFAIRAGKSIAAAAMGNARTALDGVTASTAVKLPAVASAAIADYQTLGADLNWLDRANAVLAVNAVEYAHIRAVFAAVNVIGTEQELAAFIGYRDLVCVPGLTARAVIVPDGSVGFLGRVPTIIADYPEFGVETDDESGLAVGIVRANDQTHNRIVVNADLWFGTAVLSAPAGATTAGAVNVGTKS